MFYVRSPHEEGQIMIGSALSILWMVRQYNLLINNKIDFTRYSKFA